MDIILQGCTGRLGSAVAALAVQYGGSVVAGINRRGGEGLFFPVFRNISECNTTADVIIDCSNSATVESLIEYARSRGIPAVICTTGLEAAALELINEAAKEIPLLLSANMSVGINIVSSILAQYTQQLRAHGFDIELLERHHNKKLDAPSGTALMLADTINCALNDSMSYVTDRSGERKPRSVNEIGITALRGGTITGEHTIVFAGADEVIEIKHTAFSRDIFARGALKAAHALIKRPPGLYNMNDVL